MDAYPGDPYAYMPAGGGRKRFHSIEGILPLVLLIVIAFFVLQFLGVLPCIIPIGCGGDANVLVIGVPSQDVVNTLSGKEAQMKGIKYPINFDPDYITVDMLRNYQVVILQGDPYFDMNTREAVNQYVQGGGKIIVVGDSGSKHPQYPNVAGWAWPAGQGIPVPATLIGEWAGWSDVAYGSDLRMADINHPIVRGLKLTGSQLKVPSQIFKVTPKGTVIVAIDTTEGTVPAVVEGGSGLGTVMYFAYDPGQTPSILLTTVAYLAGI
jgi:hypothetical protein